VSNGKIDDKLERMWKWAGVAYVKVLPQRLPGGTEENHSKHRLYVNINVTQMEDFVVKLPHAWFFVTFTNFRTAILHAVRHQHGAVEGNESHLKHIGAF
jgi:hypothetical protein